QAFVHGLHVTLAVSAALLLAGAVMALRLPRVMDPQTADPDDLPGPGPDGGGPGGAGPVRSGSGNVSVPVPREVRDAPDGGDAHGVSRTAVRHAPAEPAGSGRAAH
ncbi:MFS transporter, partial [Streptomyces sp. NPDC003090]